MCLSSIASGMSLKDKSPQFAAVAWLLLNVGLGNQRQVPAPIYTRRLAEMDLILELWEQIPAEIRERICRHEETPE